MMVWPVLAESRCVKKLKVTSQTPIPAKAQMKTAKAPKSRFGAMLLMKFFRSSGGISEIATAPSMRHRTSAKVFLCGSMYFKMRLSALALNLFLTTSS